MDHSAVWMMLVFYAGTCSLPLVAGDCTGIDQCSCQYDDGSGAVYLNSLGKSDLTPMWVFHRLLLRNRTFISELPDIFMYK